MELCVRYVPKMRRNLISLGVLDSKGYNYSARSGVIKVTHSIRVLMKEDKCENLYQLIGTIIVDVHVESTTGWRYDIWDGPVVDRSLGQLFLWWHVHIF